MAVNPYSGYSQLVQSYLGSSGPVNYNWSNAGDPVVDRMNSVLNYEQNRAAQRKDIEWANQQKMYNPAFWQQVFSGSGNAGGTAPMSNLANIEQSPAYKWRYDQGLEALNRTAAAKRMLGSGNRLAELVKYGQGMASQEYDNEFQRQYQLKALEQQRQLAQQQISMQGMKTMMDMMDRNKPTQYGVGRSSSGGGGSATFDSTSSLANPRGMWTMVQNTYDPYTKQGMYENSLTGERQYRYGA